MAATATIVLAAGVALLLLLLLAVAWGVRRWTRAPRLGEAANYTEMKDPAALDLEAQHGSRRAQEGGADERASSSNMTESEGEPWLDLRILETRLTCELRLCEDDVVSRGSFGEVYKCVYNGQEVAVKKLKLEHRRNSETVTSFFKEIKLMATMQHPRIVHYVGVHWEGDNIGEACLVMEFMDGGSLRDLREHWAATSHATGIDAHKATLALHVAEALAFMHSRRLIHRDVKSLNILLSHDHTAAKLADFGISRERLGTKLTEWKGTPLWMAPEVMMESGRYSFPADVYSFGVVLSELDTHDTPFARSGFRATYQFTDAVMANKATVEFSDGLDPVVRDLATRCVAFSPGDRPTAEQVTATLRGVVERLVPVRDVELVAR